MEQNVQCFFHLKPFSDGRGDNVLHAKRKGLSLVEIVMSVAVLGFLSVFVLQMFLTAERLNQEAKRMDLSVIHATSTMEYLKTGHTKEVLSTYDFFKNAKFESAENVEEIVIYFDDEWQSLQNFDAYQYKIFAVKSKAIQTDAYYSYRVEVFENNRDGEKVLYELNMLQGITP